MKKLLSIICLFFGLSQLMAQSGNIRGTISDNNGIYIPGATVYISSLNKGVVSDLDGKFTLLNVDEGTYTLEFSFLGYATLQEEVTVTAGETTSLNIVLSSANMELDEVQVTAYGLGGDAKALNAQKSNINITNVVSTDQIGRFPDANIGDAVKRIPGITMQVDQGEARDVIVRGLSPQLNSVTLNGSRIPSAEGDNRRIQMDLIPADMIQTVEVNKAVTPDMDGDAIGGSINLVTRTAPQGFRLSATAGSGLNFITGQPVLNGTLILGDRTKDGKFGWMVTGTIMDTEFGSDNVEAEWNNEFAYTNLTGDEVELDVNPFTDVFEQRTYLIQRIRRSFATNFDYQFDANNSIYFKSLYSWRDDRENRYVFEGEILDAEDIGIGDFLLNNNTPVRFPAEIKRETKGGINSDRNKNRRLEDQRMQNYTLGGDHLMGSVKIDWMASYAKASEERLDERYAVFATEYRINNDNSDPEFPNWTSVSASDEALDNFELDELTNENQYTEEEDINLFLNIEVPADLTGNGGYVKFGGRGRLKDKFRDNNFFEFTDQFEDSFATLDDVPLTDQTDPDNLVGEQYVAGQFPAPEWLGGLNLPDSAGESVPDEFLRDNFNVTEDVWAGYLMTEQNLSDKFSVLAGVRVENTQISATGNDILDEEEVVGEITRESSYTNVLPSVHLKYNITPNTIVRAAWTNTLARPNYVDLTPFRDIVEGDEEIFIGNPDLDPTTSMNFDLNIEHYFQNVGLISAGGFYKDINDFIYVFQSEVENDALGAGTTGFEVFQPLNGDNASITGFEVAFQRQLDFLPWVFENLSLYLNYTYLSSDASGIRNEDGDERQDLDLPNTAPNMFNGSLGYADDRLSLRLSANYSDAYIDEIGGNAFEDRYYDEQFFLDFNASFAFTPELRLYVDVLNLTDQPLRFFQGVSERTMQAEYYGRKLMFGIKYDLFKSN